MKQKLFKNSSRISKSLLLKTFFALLLASHTSLLTSQTAQRNIDLKSQEPSWQAVIGGVAVSPCVETSYGVALLSDGRLLSACTSSGTVIWQRSIKGRPSPYISAFGDFLYVVTDSSKVNLVNPSGMTLWTANTQFQIVCPPVPARDGRVFVQGKKNLACYGLDGKRKWKCETPEQGAFPVCLLDDGSILVFLKAAKNNQSVARRYSVFGKQMEDITFNGIVSTVESCSKGVLVSLKNGSIGLVTSAGDGSTANSKWVAGSGNTGGAFKICCAKSGETSVFFFQNGSRTEAVVVEIDSGEILNRFPVGSIAPADFKLARATPAGYFISGSYGACEFNEQGTIFFAAALPPSAKWNAIFYTNKNLIILAMKDWTMKGYVMNQTPAAKKPKSSVHEKISYISSVQFDSTAMELGIRPLSNEKMAEISKSFEKGDYGVKEEEYLELLKTEAENYIYSCSKISQSREENPGFFVENAVYTQNLLYLMSKTGTREFSVFFAKLLSGDLDTGQLVSTISFAGKNGYDEDGMVLLALENLLMYKIQTKDTTLLKTICDSTYEICRFMGRPALNKRGKNILTHMLFPAYDKNIQDYARKTLEKMITLEKK